MVKYIVLLFVVYILFPKERLLSVAYRICCKCETWYNYRNCRTFTCSRSCSSGADCLDSAECCVLATDTFKDCLECRYNPDCNNGKKCCYRYSKKQTRCRENCIGLYCDRTQDCGGREECCRNNMCVNCSTPGCQKNDECGYRQSCCNVKQLAGQRFCNSSCVGAGCAVDTDCAQHECCHERKCVKCSSLECYSNSDCSSGYCCRGGYSSDESRCIVVGCIGQTCGTSRDCGGVNECCRDNICAYCSESSCKNNFECRLGEYCCKRNGDAVCSQSCEGQLCNTNEDCGSPGECCIKNKCTTFGCSCDSNTDCKFGEYCCKSYSGSTCNSSCIGKKCFWDKDCGAPGEECTYPDSDCYIGHYGKKCPELREYKCFNKNGCYSHDDCNVFGSGYYCCGNKYSLFGRNCNSNCLKKYCDENSDCGDSSECCDSNNECIKCPNNVPAWIIGITVGISLFIIIVVGFVIRYIISKKKQQRMESQQSGIDGTEMEENSRPQNIDSTTLQSSAGSSFVDDVQSSQSTQPWTGISTSKPVPREKNAMRMSTRISKIGNESGIIPSNDSLGGHRNEENETVVPSAPPLPYPVTPPPHPPPSYQKLFGNR